jgi:hypothetical protein
MEKVEVSKEFILDLHNEVIWPSVKTKIEKEFPQLFGNMLEVGKWYKRLNDGVAIFNVQRPNDKSNIGYGLNFYNKWSESFNIGNSSHELFRPATLEEVETALINEAKNRGFKEGLYVNCLKRTEKVKISDKSSFVFNFKYNRIYYGGAKIFENGKWATIIEQPTEMTVAEIEQKLGCKIKIVG